MSSENFDLILENYRIFPKVCGHGYYGVPKKVIDTIKGTYCAIVEVGCSLCNTSAIVAINEYGIVRLYFTGDGKLIHDLMLSFDLQVRSISLAIGMADSINYDYYLIEQDDFRMMAEKAAGMFGFRQEFESVPDGWKKSSQ